MRRILPVALLVACLPLAVFAADAPATAPKPALLMTASAPATAHPGDKITVTVTVTNTTDTPQTIDIPSMWWAKSDNPSVTFPAWADFGGHGPVMIYKVETVDPGKTFTHTWEATIAAATAPGELTFKISIPLKRVTANLNGGGPTNVSSDAIKVTVEKP